MSSKDPVVKPRRRARKNAAEAKGSRSTVNKSKSPKGSSKTTTTNLSSPADLCAQFINVNSSKSFLNVPISNINVDESIFNTSPQLNNCGISISTTPIYSGGHFGVGPLLPLGVNTNSQPITPVVVTATSIVELLKAPIVTAPMAHHFGGPSTSMPMSMAPSNTDPNFNQMNGNTTIPLPSLQLGGMSLSQSGTKHLPSSYPLMSNNNIDGSNNNKSVPYIANIAKTEPSDGQYLCAGCSKPIYERFLLHALDKYWHEDCLKCNCCDCRLGEVGSTLYLKTSMMLCRRDYIRLFGTTGHCAACHKIIPACEMVMRAKNNVYHLACFACQECKQRFCVGDRYFLCENKILCEYDYEERMVFANMAAYNYPPIAQLKRQFSENPDNEIADTS